MYGSGQANTRRPCTLKNPTLPAFCSCFRVLRPASVPGQPAKTPSLNASPAAAPPVVPRACLSQPMLSERARFPPSNCRQDRLDAQTVAARLHDDGLKVSEEEVLDALRVNDGHVERTINRLKEKKEEEEEKEEGEEEEGMPQ
eukprot:scaffold36624_cov62-Phaeocystis_antarctica.AAC.7